MLELEGKAGFQTQSPPFYQHGNCGLGQGDSATELARDRDSLLVSQPFLNAIYSCHSTAERGASLSKDKTWQGDSKWSLDGTSTTCLDGGNAAHEAWHTKGTLHGPLK